MRTAAETTNEKIRKETAQLIKAELASDVGVAAVLKRVLKQLWLEACCITVESKISPAAALWYASKVSSFFEDATANKPDAFFQTVQADIFAEAKQVTDVNDGKRRNPQSFEHAARTDRGPAKFHKPSTGGGGSNGYNNYNNSYASKSLGTEPRDRFANRK